MKAQEIAEMYCQGQRDFEGLDVDDGELRDLDLRGIRFHKCFLAIDFSNSNLSGAEFTEGNIKTCIFHNCNLRGARFEGVAIEGTNFDGAEIHEMIFKNNYAYGSTVGSEFFVESKQDDDGNA